MRFLSVDSAMLEAYSQGAVRICPGRAPQSHEQENPLTNLAPRRKEMKTYCTLGMCLLASVLLIGCGGGNGGNATPASGVSFQQSISVPNVGPTTNFSFDISAVDSAKGRVYFT